MAGKGKLKAAIYVRISRDREGQRDGVDRQERDCRALAKRLHFDVVEVFDDNDRSASTRSAKPRPRYLEMLRRAEAGEFDVIVAYSNSRLTRRPREIEDLLDLHRRVGVRYQTVVSGDDDLSTADGRMTARIKGNVDTAEAERISERVTRASRGRAEAGEWHGGRIPHGYRTQDVTVEKDGKPKLVKRLVLDPVTATMMQDAAKRVLAGESLYSIASRWNDAGMTTAKGSWWRSQTIRRALLSPSIIGKREYDGNLYDGHWPPLIEEAAWNQLRELLHDPKRKFGPVDGNYGGKRPLGGGLTVCALCGKKLVSARFRNDVRLVCHKQATGGCGGVTITYVPFETWLLDLVMARIDSPRWRHENAKAPARPDGRAESLRLDKQALLSEREMLARSFELRLRTEAEVVKRRDEIDAEVNSIEIMLYELAAASVTGGVTDVADAWTLWNSADTVRRRRFLASIIEEVRVARWPAGMPTKLTRRSSERQAARFGWELETEADFEKRQDEHTREALRQRVTIKWRL